MADVSSRVCVRRARRTGATARLAGKLDQAMFVGDRDCLGAAVNPQLAEDPLDVRSDRLRANQKLTRDLGLSVSLREQSKHLALALGQILAVETSCRWFASDETSDAREHLLGGERSGEIVVCADEQTRGAIVRLGSLRRHEDDSHLVLEVVTQRLANLVPGHTRELDVEHHEAGSLLVHQREGLLVGGYLDRAVARGLEYASNGVACSRVPIDYKNERRLPQRKTPLITSRKTSLPTLPLFLPTDVLYIAQQRSRDISGAGYLSPIDKEDVYSIDITATGTLMILRAIRAVLHHVHPSNLAWPA